MAVKVTGQFIPAGDFSIIDGKDVSGNITGSNFSGSLTSTGSFGRVEATSLSGDGSGLSNVFEGTTPSSSISTRLTNLSSDSSSFSTRVTNLKTDSGSFSTRVTNLKSDSGSFSTRVTDLKSDSGSFSTRVTDLKSDSGSFSTRVTNLKSDSGSFSTRVTKNEGTGSKILAGQLEFLNITASNNTRIDGNLTVAGNYTVSGDTTFVSSSTLIIGDNIIEVNAVNPVRYGGIYVKDVDNAQTGSLIWDSTNDYWVAGQSGSEFRIPLQDSTSNLTDNRIVIAQSNGRIESGNITDDGTSVTIPLPITASSHISSSGNIFGTNLVADSASVSTRLTTEEDNIDALQTDSGSFSTRVTNLKSDSGSFSTRVTNLKADSGSFSTRVTNLKTDSASFSSRITTAETELELTLISGSAQIATQISGAFDSVSSSLSSRLQTAEAELENTLISGSAQLASQISGAFTDGFEFDGTISGSATSTGSFGSVMQNGKHFPQTNAPGENIAFGTDAGSAFVGGNVNKINIAIGLSAGSAMADYGGNVFIGKNAAKLRTRGDDNVVIGTSAGGTDGDDFGDKNVFIGLSTGRDINSTNSDQNVFIGNQAGLTSLQSISNVLIGDRAGNTLTNSSRNVAIGNFAGTGDGVTAETTENGVYIGQYARTSATDANNETVIGGSTTGKGSNTVTIGNASVTDIYLSQDQGATVHTGNVSGSSTSTGSFGRLKVDSRAIIGEAYIGQWEAAPNYAIFANSELDQTAAGNYSILAQNNGKTLINAATSREISFRINNSEKAVIDSSGNFIIDGNVSGSANSTGSFGKLEVGSQIRLIEGGDSFIKGGDFGIGTNTPVARLEIEDDGTSNSMLLKLTQDDTSVYGMVIGNDTYSTSDSVGGQHILNNEGNYIIRSLGPGAAARFGAGIAFNNYNYLEISGSTAEFTTTKISGSAASTGSFGRIEAEHIHSTDDMTVADDLTVEGLIVASGDEIRGSYSANKLTFPATQRAAINDKFFIHSTSGRGRLELVGSTSRVGSNTLFSFSRDDINEFKSDHASVTYKNFIIEADAIIAFPGSSGPTQTQDLSIFKSNVTTTADHGYGRRLFLDFRRDNTSMFTADMSGSVYAFGNISGSATSTGSFGNLFIGNNSDIQGQLFIQPQNNTNNATTAEELVIYGESSEAGIAIVANADANNYYTSYIKARYDGVEGFYIKGPSGDKFLSYGHSGTNTRIGVSDTAGTLHLRAQTISGSSVSTGSLGKLILAETTDTALAIGHDGTDSDQNTVDIRSNDSSTSLRLVSNNDANDYYDAIFRANYNDLNSVELEGPSGRVFLEYRHTGRKTLIGHSDGNTEVVSTILSGSAASTGSFGRLNIVDNVSATSFTGIFNGALSGSAQIATQISGAFAVASASFASDINNLQADSASFSTRVTNLKADSGSFSTRVTKNEGTGSKILNGELEFTNITGSGHISMSLSSTGSFGRVSATTIGGHSPLIVDSNTTFTNSITGSGHVSASLTSTASFGNMTVKSISGHESLFINTKVTASSAVQFDGKVFFETGSIEGDLHIRTNENLMRLGKSTTGVIVSGSSNVSRFATGSDGSIIDLGFTIVDEDGDTVLAGDGDGIHVDSNNYWYNNKFYRVGDARNDFLVYDAEKIKYSGEVIAQTGSINGELHIVSPTGSMFIGKFTGGIPSSGSDNISRFATGSDGSVIDLGFTTTDEDGNTVFLTTGDGIVVDSTNYWYTTGHFKIGDSDNFINWNTNNLNISGTFVGDGSGLTGIGAATVPAGTVSSSLQLATSISGSFTSVSASLAGRITDGGITLPTNTLTSSAQISTQISGAFTQPSSSISTRITTLEANPVFSSAGISGSFQILSQSLANRLTVGGLSLPTNTISSSAQLSSNISGSFTSLSQSFANRLTTGGLTLPTNTVSSSAQLAVSISGSFVQPSASFSTRVTSLEAGGGSVPTGTVSGSAQLATSISGSFNKGFEFDNSISGSATSTGSFGSVIVDNNLNVGTEIEGLGGELEIKPAGFTFTGNGGQAQFGQATAGLFHSSGRVYVRKDAGFEDYAFKAVDHPGAAGFWVDTLGRMKFGAGYYSNQAIIDMMTLGQQPGHASGSLLVSGSIIAKEGNISGSATSTGSFGAGFFDDRVGINEASPDTRLEIAGAHISGIGLAHIDSTDHAFIALDAAGASHNKGIYFQEAGVHQSILEHQGSENRLRIWDGSTTYVTIGDSTGDIHTIGDISANGNISGSATSTGSFGMVGVGVASPSEELEVAGTIKASQHIVLGQGFGLYLDGGGDTNIRSDTANEIEFNTGGSERMRLNNSGNLTVTGNISGSATSTGSFGLLQGDGSELTGITATLPSGVISGSSAGLTILGDGKVGINNATPQLKLDVSNGASGIAAHFGGNVSTSNGVVGGISFGYYESNNANYRKAGIIQEQIGDSHARGDLHLIVNTQGGQLSATAADARLTIDGLTGDVLFPGANQKISGSLTSTGSFGNIQTPLEGRVISNFTELIKVTVVSDGGNHYAFEGATAPSIQVSEGKTYRFDISDATVGSHPFRLSTTQDGTHGGGSAYTTGVTLVGTQGQAGAYLEIKVDKNTANALYYYCTAHPGMGNDGRLLKNDLMNLAAIKVTGNQVDFTNLPTSNPNVAGRLWNDSGTVKISSG